MTDREDPPIACSVLIQRDNFFLHTTGTLGATLLMLVMYFAEMFIRDDMPMPLLLHHVITILMGFWGLTLRNEPQINQLVLFITFSCVEQPSFVALICYRVASKRIARLALLFAAYFFIFTRLVCLGCSIWLMVQDWVYYDLKFKFIWIFFLMLISYTNYASVQIYFSLTNRCLDSREVSTIATPLNAEKELTETPAIVVLGPGSLVKDSEQANSGSRNFAGSKQFDKVEEKEFMFGIVYFTVYILLLSCIVVVIVVPDKEPDIPYLLDGSKNHITFFNSGRVGNSYGAANVTSLESQPSVLPDPKLVSDMLMDRKWHGKTEDLSNRNLFHISFGQFISHVIEA